MKHLFVFLTLAFGLAAPAARAGLERATVDHDGVTRHYLIYVPESLPYFAGPRPVVLVLHGGGGSDAEVRRSTDAGFDRLAEAHGFIVIYPDAIGRMWDTGAGRISSALSPRRDDAGFLVATIDAVGRRFAIDRARIFATGVSRGGMESYALACSRPGVIRAIAPAAMTLPVAQKAACATGAPLGIALFEGTADPIVPYDGGRVTVRGRPRDAVTSADATMAVFARRNGCAGSVQRRIGAVQRTDWHACKAATRLYRIEGGGHGWPGGHARLPERLVGPTNRDLSAPDEIWAFFSRF